MGRYQRQRSMKGATQRTIVMIYVIYDKGQIRNVATQRVSRDIQIRNPIPSEVTKIWSISQRTAECTQFIFCLSTNRVRSKSRDPTNCATP